MRLGQDLILIIFYFRKLKDDNAKRIQDYLELSRKEKKDRKKLTKRNNLALLSCSTPNFENKWIESSLKKNVIFI